MSYSLQNCYLLAETCGLNIYQLSYKTWYFTCHYCRCIIIFICVIVIIWRNTVLQGIRLVILLWLYIFCCPSIHIKPGRRKFLSETSLHFVEISGTACLGNHLVKRLGQLIHLLPSFPGNLPKNRAAYCNFSLIGDSESKHVTSWENSIISNSWLAASLTPCTYCKHVATLTITLGVRGM